MAEAQIIEARNEWQPITDLPNNWQDLSVSELSSLARVWAEQHERLKESQAVKEFNERLRREWSIETGVLERLYTIDRGVTRLLIEQGIDAALIPHGATDDRPAGEIILILQDHREALEGLFDFVASRQPLMISYIRQLHQVITRHQPYVEGIDMFGNPTRQELLRGNWKKWPNNPTRPDGSVHEYCPPLQVDGEIERLVTLYNSHSNVPPEVNAAWLHHRFTQIHPFQDGNGRVARALATIVFLQAGWFPLVINRDRRGDYISALEAADRGDLTPLVRLFGQNAKSAFARALDLSEDVLQGEKALPGMMERLVSVYQARPRFRQVEILADEFITEAQSLLREVEAQIRQKFATVNSPPIVRVNCNNERNGHYYTAQIISIARELDYWANIARRRSWVCLHITDPTDGQKTQIVFSFHYFGKVNRGVMVCTGFVYFPETKSPEPQLADSDLEPELSLGETHRVCSEPFYFSYQDRDHLDGLKADFRKWMSEAVSVGLAEWAQRL